MAWKYMGWLNGMNGGPLRAPTMRLTSDQMRIGRRGLLLSELPRTEDQDELFYLGRTRSGSLVA
jgi:4-hydroxy-tetrahydrodipicolinate synthase